MNRIPTLIVFPLLNIPEFAERSGLSLETVRSMVNRGQLPSKKIGRRRMVNVAALLRDALEVEVADAQ